MLSWLEKKLAQALITLPSSTIEEALTHFLKVTWCVPLSSLFVFSPWWVPQYHWCALRLSLFLIFSLSLWCVPLCITISQVCTTPLTPLVCTSLYHHNPGVNPSSHQLSLVWTHSLTHFLVCTFLYHTLPGVYPARSPSPWFVYNPLTIFLVFTSLYHSHSGVYPTSHLLWCVPLCSTLPLMCIL